MKKSFLVVSSLERGTVREAASSASRSCAPLTRASFTMLPVINPVTFNWYVMVMYWLSARFPCQDKTGSDESSQAPWVAYIDAGIYSRPGGTVSTRFTAVSVTKPVFRIEIEYVTVSPGLALGDEPCF